MKSATTPLPTSLPARKGHKSSKRSACSIKFACVPARPPVLMCVLAHKVFTLKLPARKKHKRSAWCASSLQPLLCVPARPPVLMCVLAHKVFTLKLPARKKHKRSAWCASSLQPLLCVPARPPVLMCVLAHKVFTLKQRRANVSASLLSNCTKIGAALLANRQAFCKRMQPSKKRLITRNLPHALHRPSACPSGED